MDISHPESRICLPPFSGFRSPVSGFTLVELMTVIAIIAVLAGLILGIAGYAVRKADISRAMADMEKIKNALEEYRLAYGPYPTNRVANNSSNWVSALWQKQQFLVLKGWNDTTGSIERSIPGGTIIAIITMRMDQPGLRHEQ